jgi:hypothetical protein
VPAKISHSFFPNAADVILVPDNLNTHDPASHYQAFAPAGARLIWDRLDVHYTPKHGNWPNIPEIEFSVLSRQCLDRGIPDHPAVDWRFTTEDVRIKLRHLYSVSDPSTDVDRNTRSKQI